MLFHTDSNATVSTLPTPPNSPYTHTGIIVTIWFVKLRSTQSEGFFLIDETLMIEKEDSPELPLLWMNRLSLGQAQSGTADQPLRHWGEQKKKSYFRFTSKCWKSSLSSAVLILTSHLHHHPVPETPEPFSPCPSPYEWSLSFLKVEEFSLCLKSSISLMTRRRV